MKRLLFILLMLSTFGIPYEGFAWAQAPLPPAPTPVPAPTPPTPTPVPPAWFLDGETTVPQYALAKFTLSGGTATALWLVMPDASEFQQGQTLVFTAAPGNYTVVCFAVSPSNQPILLKALVTLQGSPVPPVPPVPPGPGPVPPPGPTPAPTGKVWAVAVYDTAQQVSLPSGQLAIYGSPTIRDVIEKAGAYWKRFDVGDSVPAKSGIMPLAQTKWGAAAVKAGLPALVLIDSSGAVLSATPLPATEDSVVAAVKAAVKP